MGKFEKSLRNLETTWRAQWLFNVEFSCCHSSWHRFCSTIANQPVLKRSSWIYFLMFCDVHPTSSNLPKPHPNYDSGRHPWGWCAHNSCQLLPEDPQPLLPTWSGVLRFIRVSLTGKGRFNFWQQLGLWVYGPLLQAAIVDFHSAPRGIRNPAQRKLWWFNNIQ